MSDEPKIPYNYCMTTNKASAPAFLPRLNVRPPQGATALAEWTLVPLRLFLGFTFAFAGLQKLANPNFFLPAAPISIQHQLAGAVHFSPIHSLLHAMLPYAGFVGMVVAYSELAIGLGTLVGFLSRTAAIGGAVLSLNLFLAISFHSSPYYTGADLVFFFAWLPLVLTPGGPQLSLDGYIARAVKERHDYAMAQQPSSRTSVEIQGIDRRTVVVTGATAAALGTATLLLGGTTAAMGKLIGNATTTASPATTTTTPTGSTGAGPGHLLGSAATVPIGSAATFTIPTSGDPGIVFHNADGSWTAYDTVCPHAGCTVGWSKGASMLVCPCHGSQFQVATGAVITGPASQGLVALKIVESGGHLYLV